MYHFFIFLSFLLSFLNHAYFWTCQRNIFFLITMNSTSEEPRTGKTLHTALFQKHIYVTDEFAVLCLYTYCLNFPCVSPDQIHQQVFFFFFFYMGHASALTCLNIAVHQKSAVK